MRLQTELTQYPSEYTITITNPTRDVVILRDLITCLFEGTIADKVLLLLSVMYNLLLAAIISHE